MITQMIYNNNITPLGSSGGGNMSNIENTLNLVNIKIDNLVNRNINNLYNTLNLVDDKVNILLSQSEYKNGYNAIYDILNSSNVFIAGSTLNDITNTINNMATGYSTITQALINQGAEVLSNDPNDISDAVSRLSLDTYPEFIGIDQFPKANLARIQDALEVYAKGYSAQISSSSSNINIVDINTLRRYITNLKFSNASMTSENYYSLMEVGSVGKVYCNGIYPYTRYINININTIGGNSLFNISIVAPNKSSIYVTNAAHLFAHVNGSMSFGLSGLNNLNFSICEDMSYAFFSVGVNFINKHSTAITALMSHAQNTKYFNYTFAAIPGNKALKINIDSYNLSSAIAMVNMFASTTLSVYMNNLITPKLKTIYGIFASMGNASAIYISNWDTHSVKNMGYMFYNSLANVVGLETLNTSSVRNMTFMFYKSNVASNNMISLNNWDTSHVIDMGSMFINTSIINSLMIKNWNVINVKYMNYMFSNSKNLLYFSGFNSNVSNVWNISGMFCNCINIKNIDLSNFDFSNIVDASEIFINCRNLTTIYYDPNNFNIIPSIIGDNAFYNCTNLVGPGGSYSSGYTYLNAETVARYFTPKYN